jgi:predicted transcriptional regulator
MSKQAYTVSELATKIGVSQSMVYLYIKKGLPHERVPIGRWRKGKIININWQEYLEWANISDVEKEGK